MLRKLLALLLAMMTLTFPALAQEDQDWDLDVEEYVSLDGDEQVSLPLEEMGLAEPPPPREDFIDRIIELGRELYEEADGKAQRAHYSGDIYVCKNFTTYLFRQCREDFRMAAYPETQLIIPNNLPAKDCRPYYYGLAWEEKTAEQGNPFEVAASFRYDSSLSKKENMALACDFMRQAKRGDFFQISCDYEYGVGAHSAIIIADWDSENDEIHWMDSNMRGKKVNGERYGIVQFDEIRDVTWWAEVFCHKRRGATLYRLREDIIYAQ